MFYKSLFQWILLKMIILAVKVACGLRNPSVKIWDSASCLFPTGSRTIFFQWYWGWKFWSLWQKQYPLLTYDINTVQYSQRHFKCVQESWTWRQFNWSKWWAHSQVSFGFVSMQSLSKLTTSLFTEATVFELRLQCLELMSDQLEMLILGRLDGHSKERVGMKQYRSYYFVRGHQVCWKRFFFLECISKKRLLNLKLHVRSNGLAPRVHRNQKSTPHNRTPHSSLQNVVSFIDNYAQEEGLLLPGRVPGYKSFRMKLLHTSTTKAELWRAY